MATSELIPDPLARNLRIFAFDPSVAAQLDSNDIAEITIGITWEENLGPGPIGEYIEVVDADPASGVFYKPVDLNDSRLLAQNGLAPSERNPQFHQQMVYAVAMTTINHFEQALGRVALWSPHRTEDHKSEEFVRRLRIYPHALRDRNAYYSPEKKALMFGYFPVNILDANNTPGTLVFTCLSHDIIAHETTHALLDGVHPRFNEAVNGDVLAFHEAFADIVALFQHFSYPGVLRDQIARTRGNLAGENLLGQLAQQFGRATGRGDALRQYLGKKNDKGEWEAVKPDVRALSRTNEPHERGAILVAAVFGAFLKMYRLRSLDLYRIASDGSGVLRAGDIHPDLANRLAGEARRAAQYTLQMCIRALDYCPPVNLTFGDYLRAIITGDQEYNAEDTMYRVAFVQSFQEWGIHPIGRSSMSAEGLLWPASDELFSKDKAQVCRRAIRSLFKNKRTIDPTAAAQQSSQRTRSRLPTSMEWNLESDRKKAWEAIDDHAIILWNWLILGEGRVLAADFGLVLEAPNAPPLPTILRSRSHPASVAVEVHSVRTSLRRTPRGGTTTDLVVEITQRRIGYFDPEEQEKVDKMEDPVAYDPKSSKTFLYRAGCTLLIDPVQMKLRRVIRTPGTIADNVQLERVRSYLLHGSGPPNAFDSAKVELHEREPFAMLHHSLDD